MPLKTEAAEEPGLNLTPMIDIVLLLVIFFMVATQFTKQETQYEIQLPKVSEAQPLTSLPDELIVNVTAEGAIYCDGRLVSIEELETQLRDAQQRYADQIVVIRGDGGGKYQNVMSILNLCKRARIRNIQLANRVEATAGS